MVCVNMQKAFLERFKKVALLEVGVRYTRATIDGQRPKLCQPPAGKPRKVGAADVHVCVVARLRMVNGTTPPPRAAGMPVVLARWSAHLGTCFPLMRTFAGLIKCMSLP